MTAPPEHTDAIGAVHTALLYGLCVDVATAGTDHVRFAVMRSFAPGLRQITFVCVVPDDVARAFLDGLHAEWRTFASHTHYLKLKSMGIISFDPEPWVFLSKRL